MECLHRSLIIILTEHGQWQASFTPEKSACLMEFSVTNLIQYKSFQKSCENRACTNSVYQFLVSLPTHESLGTMRLQCFFPLKFAVQYLVFHQFNCVKLCIRSIDSLTPTHQLTTLPVHCPTHPSHPTNSPPPNPSTHSLTHPQSRPSLWLPCPPQENNRRYSQEE